MPLAKLALAGHQVTKVNGVTAVKMGKMANKDCRALVDPQDHPVRMARRALLELMVHAERMAAWDLVVLAVCEGLRVLRAPQARTGQLEIRVPKDLMVPEVRRDLQAIRVVPVLMAIKEIQDLTVTMETTANRVCRECREFRARMASLETMGRTVLTAVMAVTVFKGQTVTMARMASLEPKGETAEMAMMVVMVEMVKFIESHHDCRCWQSISICTLSANSYRKVTDRKSVV